MVGINFALVASLVAAANLPSALASPAMRYGLNHWGGFGSLVRMAIKNPDPGAGAGEEYLDKVKHLASLGSDAAPGVPGNVMVVDASEAMPFYVLDNQLFQVQNSSSILYVNIVNTTDTLAPTAARLEVGEDDSAYVPNQRFMSVHTRMPTFRLTLGKRPAGLRGKWMWDDVSEALAFQMPGTDELRGKFYSCANRGVYVGLDEMSKYPVLCQPMKLF